MKLGGGYKRSFPGELSALGEGRSERFKHLPRTVQKVRNKVSQWGKQAWICLLEMAQGRRWPGEERS